MFTLRTQIFLGLAIAGFMGSAAAVGPVGPGYLGNLSGQSVSIGNSFGPASVFNDLYTFDILPLSSVAGTAVTINLDIPLLTGAAFSISNFGVEFRDSLDHLITSDFQMSPTDYTVEILANLAAATGYKFLVSGDVTGTLGGSYGGALAAAPIPEPRDWMLMLSGLGLVGLMVGRHKRRLY